MSRPAHPAAALRVGTPAWRGDRAFHTRRTADQEHAVLLSVDPDGRERVLVDPIAVDHTGATTLDAWQPSKDGDLFAYQLSAGEPRNRCSACSTWRRGRTSTARSTGHATPPSPGYPTARRSTTHGGSAPTSRRMSRSSATAWTRPTTTVRRSATTDTG
ncbi:MAG: hypothetical protein ACRDWI_02135 [Jiangellaceae bacterium]